MAWEDLLRRITSSFWGRPDAESPSLAVHLALELARQGREVHFFDLDQTKPLMRSRDAEGLLEKAGVSVHFQRSTPTRPHKWVA